MLRPSSCKGGRLQDQLSWLAPAVFRNYPCPWWSLLTRVQVGRNARSSDAVATVASPKTAVGNTSWRQAFCVVLVPFSVFRPEIGGGRCTSSRNSIPSSEGSAGMPRKIRLAKPAHPKSSYSIVGTN
jgi:hypothetical protein